MLCKTILTGLFITLFLSACSGGASRDDKDESGGPLRTGTTVKEFVLKFYDGNSDISSDGNIVAFISGRNEKRQAFFKDRDSKGAATRLLSGDYGQEVSVKVSPDGVFALVLSNLDGVYKIILKKIGSDDAEQVVVDSNLPKSDLEVSPDNKFFVYQQVKSDGTREIILGELEADLSLKDTTAVGDDSSLTRPRWLSTTGGYELVASKVNAQNGKTEFFKLKFSGFSDAKTATAEKILEGNVTDTKQVHASSGSFLFIQDVFNTGELKEKVSIGNTENPQTVNVLNESALVKPNATEATSLNIDGFRVNSFHLNQGGELASISTQNSLSCTDESDKTTIRYVAVPQIFVFSGEKSTILLPKISEDKWSIAGDDFCDVDSTFDFTIDKIKINSGATESDFVAVYESRFSEDPKTFGDREVFVIVKESDKLTVEAVSSNRSED